MAFEKADRTIMRVVSFLALFSGLFMAVIAVAATANVLSSKIFMWSIPSINDYITYLFLGVVYCSIAYCQLGPGLICVDIISRHYPPLVSNLLSVLSSLLGMGIFGLIFHYSVPLFRENLAMKVMSSTGKGGFPLWPFNLTVVVFSALMVLAMAWTIVRVFARGVTKSQRPAGPDEKGEAEA